MTTLWVPVKKKKRQYARIYAQCRERDANFKKNQKGVLEVNDTVTEMKNAMVLISSSVDRTQPRKESIILKYVKTSQITMQG